MPPQKMFAQRYLDVSGVSEQQKFFCMFVLELAVVDYKMLKYIPTKLASAAVYVALHLYKPVERRNNCVQFFWVC